MLNERIVKCIICNQNFKTSSKSKKACGIRGISDSCISLHTKQQKTITKRSHTARYSPITNHMTPRTIQRNIVALHNSKIQKRFRFYD